MNIQHTLVFSYGTTPVRFARKGTVLFFSHQMAVVCRVGQNSFNGPLVLKTTELEIFFMRSWTVFVPSIFGFKFVPYLEMA